MKMNQGIYEQLVTQLISLKLNELDKNSYQYKLTKLDKEEAAETLSKHIGESIRYALSLITGDN
jgi:hypothetical protein